MIILIFGLVLFFGAHIFPSFVGVRSSLIARLGEGPYKGLYSIISLAGFILIIAGKSKADFQPLWEPPLWSSSIAPILMLLSFVLLAAGNMPSNFKRFTRHPMLWGVTIWSVTHLLANGDLSSALLFGVFGIFSLFDMVSSNLRGATRQDNRLPIKKDLTVVAAGIFAFLLFFFLHPVLFGVSVS